jgi:hypothetical protein
VTPFKVQVNFDIHLFEGYIDAYDLEKWLDMLEGYYSIQKNSNTIKITSLSLNPFPMSNIGGNVIGRDITKTIL